MENSPKAAVGPYLFKNLAANANTLVRTGQGLLHTITINSKGASANVVTVYDGTDTSGTKIATIDSTVTYGSLIFDCEFAVGLYITIGTGTAADITVTYR